MFPSSFAVVVVGASLMAIALLAFLWGWRGGHFTRLDRQMGSILSPDEMRYERPWETAAQKEQRQRRHGPLVSAPAGEWGEGTNS